MAQLIKPQNVKIITKDGELLISLQLDININLNQSGNFVSSESNSSPIVEEKKKEEDAMQWAIPDFKPLEKIKFGK